MDLNLYMSYSESWGLVAYESEAMGVPCIHSFQVDYLEIINEAEYQNLSKLYQDMFKTFSELENSSGLEVNYNLVNSQIEALQKVGLDISTITRSVQENSLER